MTEKLARPAPVRRRLAPPPRLASRLLILILLALPARAVAADRWRPIGPEGASIEGVAAAPGRSGLVYAVTGRFNVVRSSDGGASWSPRGKIPGFWKDLAVDPTRPDILYARSFSDVFKSTDGGLTWSASLSGGFFWTFRVAPSTPDLIYAAREEELLKSVDGGAHWSLTGLGPQPVLSLAIDPADSHIVYAGSLRDGGVLRSDDGGATWLAVNTGLERPDGGLAVIFAIQIDPRHPETLYAAGTGGVYKSVDRGASWSNVWGGPDRFSYPEKLALDPGSGALYAVTRDYGVYQSRDGGASWSHSLPIFAVAGIACDAQSGQVYAGTDASGFLRSPDGLSWTVSNHGLRELGFIKVAADPHTPGGIFAVATPTSGFLGVPQFLLRTTDGGTHWTSPFGSPDSSPHVNEVVADPSRRGTWYLAVAGGVLKTGDGGESWQNVRQGMRQIEFVHTVALAPSDPETLYALGWDTFPVCGGGNCPQLLVYRSPDGGAEWRRARVSGLAPQQLLGALAVDAFSLSTVYAAGTELFKSTNGGSRWVKTGAGLRNMTALEADPFAPGTLYAAIFAASGRKVFKSTNGGATFRPASSGLPASASVWDLAADPKTPGRLYAATSRGVYVTDDGGRRWTARNDGLEGLSIETVAVDPARPGVVYAGGLDGLFELSTRP